MNSWYVIEETEENIQRLKRKCFLRSIFQEKKYIYLYLLVSAFAVLFKKKKFFPRIMIYIVFSFPLHTLLF